MLDAIKAPLVAGQKVLVTLKFDGGESEVTIELKVQPLVPAAGEHAHH